MKRVASALVVSLVFFAVQNVQAFNPQGGNALWGKYAIQTCRSCHKEKGLTALDPHERSREQWEDIFADDYKKLREMSHDFSAVGINDRQLENIYRYLVETSAKSVSAASVAASPAAKREKPAPAAKKSTATSKQQSDKKFDMAAGDPGKGRYIFRKCLNCHKKKRLLLFLRVIGPRRPGIASLPRISGNLKRRCLILIPINILSLRWSICISFLGNMPLMPISQRPANRNSF